MSHDNSFKSRFLMASLAWSFLVFTGAAMGGPAQGAKAPPQYDKAIVFYGDLNLDSQQGTKTLYARLRNGAEDACSSFDGRNLLLKKLWQNCYDEAMNAAVLQVNRDSLTTLHKQTVGGVERYR